MHIKYIQSEHEFFALRQAWNHLADKTAPCVFLRHEWFSAAWAWVKNDAALYLICVYREHELIGLCPLIYRRTRRWGLTFRHLEFLAVPDTQHCDILGAPVDATLVIATIAGALQQTHARWETCVLSKLKNNALASTLPAALQLKSAVLEAPGNPVVTLSESWKDYYGGRSRRLKKNNNLVANRLSKAGELEVVWINTILEPAALETWLQTAIQISAKSWKEKTGLSLDHPGPQRFIRALSDAANQNNWLSLWLLKLNGQAIAMEYQLNYAGQVHALRADFDADFVQYSPGAYLNWQLLKGLFDSAAQNYYMGPGNNAYKLRWTDNKILLQDLTIYSHNWRGRLVELIDMYCRPLRRYLMKVFAVK